jgi:acyl carrier protein
MSGFEIELRDKVLARLKLLDVDPATVTAETSFFDGGLGLDSVDALEIAILIEEEYGIIIKVSERNESTFGTLGQLARFVQERLNRDLPAAPAKTGTA